MNLIVEDPAHFMGDGNRQCRLADAARPDDRNELLIGQLQLDRGQGIFSSKHAYQARRQSGARERLDMP